MLKSSGVTPEKVSYQQNIPAGKTPFALYFFIIPLLSFLFLSCSDSPTSTGSGLLQIDNINVIEVNSLTSNIAQNTSQIKNVIPLSTSAELLVGKVNNAESGFLVDFFVSLTDTLRRDIRNNSVNIISSTVKLKNIYAIGDTSNLESLKFSVFKVNSTWGSGFTSDSLSLLNYNPVNLAANLLVTDSLTTFNLDNSIISPLLDDTLPGHYTGFYLKPDADSKVVIGYLSESGFDANAAQIEIPHIEIIVEKPGVYRDTIYFLSIEDVSVVTADVPSGDNENIFLQSGVSIDSRLWFDLSFIPPNAVINNAELILTVDTTKTILGTDYESYLTAYAVLDTLKPDSTTTSSAQLKISKGKATGNITQLIQFLYHNANNGLLLKTGYVYQGLEFYTIKSSAAIDPASRPQLKIIYTNNK